MTPQLTDEEKKAYLDAALLQIEEIKSRTRGNPLCCNSCHGRGWTGVTFVPDSQLGSRPVLQMCGCGKDAITEYDRTMKAIAGVKATVESEAMTNRRLIQAEFKKLNDRRFSVRLGRLWQRITRKEATK